jgi:hypothetical protein
MDAIETIETIETTKTTKTIKVTGRIYPTDWDAWDNVERVGIEPTNATDEYEEYYLVDNEVSRELRQMLHRVVTVEGLVFQDDQGDWQVTATSWCR